MNKTYINTIKKALEKEKIILIEGFLHEKALEELTKELEKTLWKQKGNPNIASYKTPKKIETLTNLQGITQLKTFAEQIIGKNKLQLKKYEPGDYTILTDEHFKETTQKIQLSICKSQFTEKTGGRIIYTDNKNTHIVQTKNNNLTITKNLYSYQEYIKKATCKEHIYTITLTQTT